MSRRGTSLTLVERTTAVLRALDGEDHAALAEEYRVRVQHIQKWIDNWNDRTGCWGRVPLLELERAAGYSLGDPDPSRGLNWCGEPIYRKPMVRHARPDPNASHEAAADARAWFLALLGDDPPDRLDGHERAWKMLADHDRALFLAAWDTYCQAAELRAEARRKVRRACDLAAAEIGISAERAQ